MPAPNYTTLFSIYLFNGDDAEFEGKVIRHCVLVQS